MSNPIPIKHKNDGLSEFEQGDAIHYAFGGTNATSLEEAKENLGINTKAEQADTDAALDTKLDKIDYVQHFRGLFSSFAALTEALPIALDGDYAHIDSGSGFDRMAAIFDTDDGAWKVSAANVGANTDEIPEGSANLYFKGERVLNTALTGLTDQPAAPILASDLILEAMAKLQSQLNNASTGQAVWVSALSIGTPDGTGRLDLSKLEFAKINGLLFVRGKVITITEFDGSGGQGNVILNINDNNYKINMSSSTSSIEVFISSVRATSTNISRNIYLSVKGNATTNTDVLTSVQRITSSKASTEKLNQSIYGYEIQPTALGTLLYP